MIHCRRTNILSEKGVTLPEIIMVMAIIVILAAIAAPDLVTFIKNANSRSAARQAASVLRQARSTAIATNKAQQVVFNNNTYGFGNADNIPGITNWNTMPKQITTGGTTTIQFASSGVASFVTGTINIEESVGAKLRYEIIVHQTGRIRVEGPF